jgi:hypothetical protein
MGKENKKGYCLSCETCSDNSTCLYRQSSCPKCGGTHIRPFKFSINSINFPVDATNYCNLMVQVWTCWDCSNIWKVVAKTGG